MPFDLTLTMTYFGFLLGIGVIAANLLKKINLPDTLFLLLLGLLLGPTIFKNPMVAQYVDVTLVDVNAMGQVPDFLRTLALVLIVFMGTFNLSWRVFKRLSDISVKLAFIGMVFNTLVLGIAACFIFGLNPVYALLLAAIISGTEGDIIGVFERSLSKFKESITIIKIEAILNSPLTILFPFIFLDMVKLQPGALFEPLKYLSQFWLMIAAGIGTGIIIGLAVGKLVRKMTKEYTALLLLSIALITYALAENVGGSGILAVAVCGLVSGNMMLKPEEKEIVTGFENQLAEMLRISVFMLLGAQVMLPFDLQQIALVFAFFLIVFFARPVFLLATLGKTRSKYSKRDLALMSFIAPKGLSAAAMIPIAALVISDVDHPDVGNQMVNIIFLVILFSILFSTLTAIALSRTKKKQKTVTEFEEEGKTSEETSAPSEKPTEKSEEKGVKKEKKP